LYSDWEHEGFRRPVIADDDPPGDVTREITHMAETIIEVTDDSFQVEVIESEIPILVDFWAPWCAPCRAISPLLEEIAEGRDDVRIVKVNVDENQETAATYGIMSIPTLILFNNGAEAKRLRPTRSKSQLEEQLELEPAA
jgi:thioredoxin 1